LLTAPRRNARLIHRARHQLSLTNIRRVVTINATRAAVADEEFIVEYTDAPQPAVSADTMECPLCGHVLPKDADHCDRCDWVRTNETVTAEGKASDGIAVLLSVVPGLGHVYKGQKTIGLLLIFAVTPLIAFFSFLAAIASAGFGFGLFFFYWIAVAIHAYGVEDRVGDKPDEGEQY
jgi:hypothetical protein